MLLLPAAHLSLADRAERLAQHLAATAKIGRAWTADARLSQAKAQLVATAMAARDLPPTVERARDEVLAAEGALAGALLAPLEWDR